MSNKGRLLREIKEMDRYELASMIMSGHNHTCDYCIFQRPSIGCGNSWNECEKGMKKFFEQDKKKVKEGN